MPAPALPSQRSNRTWTTWLYGMLVPSLLAVLLFVLLIFCFILPTYRRSMLDYKKEMIRTLTESVVSILKDHHRLVETKRLSQEESQSQALNQIRQIRYGPEMKDYFWISDRRAYMVMHPYRTDLENQDLSNYRDQGDKRLFIEFVKAVEDNGGGYVDYHWQWKDDPNRIEEKLSYVQLFEPWGWIIGTGIYLDDVHREFALLSRRLAFYAAFILVGIGLLIGTIVIRSAISEKQHQRAEKTILELNAELEQRVIQRTAELEAANEELKAFAYSVSHDLRAPLRSINGFSQALIEEHSQILNDEACDYLQRVRHASQQMDEQIEDILKLSRMTCAEIHYEELSLSQLCESIVTGLQSTDPQRHVTWLIEPDMQVHGDPNLLRVVMQNLLENAWKFTTQGDDIHITVGTTTEDGQKVFYVKDNGAGFDMAYADKLFGVFQRLHRPEEFPGHGIGLASVQSIIRRHGGRTWAEGVPNQGATFYFTLGNTRATTSVPSP